MKSLKPTNGSSEASAFHGVTYRSVVELVRVIQSSSLRSEQQIQKVFSRHAEGFAPVAAFCRRLRIISSREGRLALDEEAPKASADQFAEYLLRRIIRGKNRYRAEVYRLLRRFELKDGYLAYASPEPRRAREQPSRNFLMELRVIRYRAGHREHFVTDEHLWVYAAARESSAGTPPAVLRSSLRSRSELGMAAELAVVDFERERVGPHLANEVKHIALTNVSAGYDVRSITVHPDSRQLPRYIEVKAVSRGLLSFYWTRGEADVAETLGPYYYLYLLPVEPSGGFDIAGLRIVADPFSTVLDPGSNWAVEADVMKCSLVLAGESVADNG